MYGWRGRIGLLVPAVNTVVEPEMFRMMPEGVTVHSARMGEPIDEGPSRDALSDHKHMVREAIRAARDIAGARVDVIAFACTSGSFFDGSAGERKLLESIQQAAGIPAVTAIGAVLEALNELGARRLILATPYTDQFNDLEVAFLRSQGYEVLRSRGLKIPDAFDTALESDDRAYRLARETFDPSADVIFISCTNFPTLNIISALEADTGLPVVTSNLAIAWACLRRLHASPQTAGLGRLFSKPFERTNTLEKIGSGSST